MKISRPPRFLAALFTIFCLLFSQLAVASYACPGTNMAGTSMTAGVSNGTMAGCPGMDKQQPGLCKAHCEVGHQSLDTPGAPNVQPFIAAELAVLLLESARHHPVATRADLDRLTRTTAPPIAIRNCCFRI